MLDIDITRYVPQRLPFLMISGAIEVAPKEATTFFSISRHCPLVENGKLKAGGIIENIAQSSAFYAGYSYKANGEQVPIGFISSIKNLSINAFPRIGETIQTRAAFINEVMDFKIFEGEVKNKKQEILATCELRVFIKHS